MASADAVNRPRDALPPISHLELDKLKTERPEGRFSSINGIGASIAPMNSPSTAYSGPPPPYSYGPPPATSHQPGYISPPESATRRSTRDDEKSSPARNALPSIHEALGGERSLPLSASSQQGTGSTPSTAISAHFPEAPKGPSGPANPFSAPSFRDNPFSSHPQSNPPPPPDLRSRESAVFPQPPSPRTSAPAGFLPGPLANSTFGSRSEQQPPHSSSGQEQQRQPFSFTPVPKPPPSNYSGETFHFQAPSTASEQRHSFARGPEPSYDHTIKRHIDVHEAARDLNDIREISTRLYDGSQNWTHRYHQGNRSGFFQDSLPPLHEIDDMMRQSHLMLENLARVKEVVIQQQNALSEHRARFSRPIEDEYAAMPDEYKAAGFAAGDAKKRRGKAAPPGRCHSCNRAETPEWRRGPDGARTLCNACGLHYAKLTRKIGVSKAAAITGSNLRPKSLDHRP